MSSPRDLIFYGAFLCSNKVCIDISSPYVQVGYFVLVWLFCLTVCFVTKKNNKIHRIGHAVNSVVSSSPPVYRLFTTFQQKLQSDYSFSSQNVSTDCQVPCAWFLQGWLSPGLAEHIASTHALSLSHLWFPAIVMVLDCDNVWHCFSLSKTCSQIFYRVPCS